MNLAIILSRCWDFFLSLAGLVLLASLAFAQDHKPFTVTVKEGQTIRELAQEYLHDPDLWQEILKSNNLKSPTDIKPGMTLIIPSDAVTISADRLRDAQSAIQKATDAGAKVFMPELIAAAIANYDLAVDKRKNGDWENSINLADNARTAAEEALRETLAKRNTTADALLSDRKGEVEKRKPAETLWSDAPLQAILNESDRVRTLSKSYAEITFHDASRIRLNENSQAVIQSMRVDLLEKKRETSVSLVKGDAFAFLKTNQTKRKFDLEIPGVETKVNSNNFWVQKDEQLTKIANYEGEIEVTSQGSTVLIGENQGSLVAANQKPSQPKVLLAAPVLVSPINNAALYTNQIALNWTSVPGAVGYWLELASDPSFQKIVLSEKNLSSNQLKHTFDASGVYYWRVAAVDADGLPGPGSAAGFFNVQFSGKAPFLLVTAPKEQEIFKNQAVTVRGKTEANIQLTLNGEPVSFLPDGSFEVSSDLNPGKNELTFEARNLAGIVSKITRTVTYDADAAVPIVYDATLRQSQPKHFVVQNPEFTLRGTTRPSAAVVLNAGSSSPAGKTFSDAHGRFQFTIRNLTKKSDFTISVITVSGYAAADTISVEVDDEPPSIRLQPDLPEATNSSKLQIQGSVIGATRLELNGQTVELDAGQFATEVPLVPGRNILKLTAADFAGNRAVLEEAVTYDNAPPELLTHQVIEDPRPGSGERLIQIVATARDGSALKRTARFTLQLGKDTIFGYLIHNKVSRQYQGLVKAAVPPGVTAKLAALALADYLGNQKEYQLK